MSQKHCTYVARRLQLQGEYWETKTTGEKRHSPVNTNSLAFITLKG